MRKILFKLRQFPHLSETFILAQIVTAIKADLEVHILVSEVLDFESSTHQEVLKKYEIEEKIILEDYGVPRNRFIRILKAIFIILNRITLLKYLLGFLRLKNSFSLTWIYQFEFFSKFRGFDIYHIQYGTNIHPIDLLKKEGLYSGHLIVSFHGHDAFFPINGFIKNEGYYKHLFVGGNIIVANTSYLAKKIEELGCPAENILTIPVGVNNNFFRVQERDRNAVPVKFINVGRLDKVKGQIYSIEFVKMMREREKNVELTIVGDGAEKENLMQVINENNLSGYVSLVGKKSQEEVRKYLADSQVYLFTAVPLEDGRRETQGLATLEAQASGLPVLAFDSGGVKYTVLDEETGYLCEEYDMQCLLRKGSLLLDPDLRKRMGERAIQFVNENFSQDKIDSIWKNIYCCEWE